MRDAKGNKISAGDHVYYPFKDGYKKLYRIIQFDDKYEKAFLRYPDLTFGWVDCDQLFKVPGSPVKNFLCECGAHHQKHFEDVHSDWCPAGDRKRYSDEPIPGWNAKVEKKDE